MPVYDYLCRCGHMDMDIRCISDREQGPKCTQCGEQMKLTVSPVKGIVRNPAVAPKEKRP